MLSIYLLLLRAFFPSAPAQDLGTTLTVRVELSDKLKSPQVYVAVYTNADDFPDHPERTAHQFSKLASDGRVEVELQVKEAKSCAIACFADLNNNGKLDTNWLGIPKEPYAFSGVNKWYSKPTWQRSQILLNGSAVNYTLQLK